MSDQETPSQWDLNAARMTGKDDAEMGFPCHSPYLNEDMSEAYREGYKSVAAVAPEEILWGRQARSQKSEAKP